MSEAIFTISLLLCGLAWVVVLLSMIISKRSNMKRHISKIMIVLSIAFFVIHFGIEFEINGTDSPQSVQEIKDLLGDNYNEYLYSRELRTNGITYADAENGIILTFIYSMDDGRLFWAILSSPDG